MVLEWNEKHGNILKEFFKQLNSESIKWFIVRGYEGLPDKNNSKDVDVIVEIGKEKKAAEILKKVFKVNGLEYLHKDKFGHITCYIGMSLKKQMSIHIDLIEGYVSKGYEVFSFDELYKHVIKYNDLFVLDEYMNGVMLLVYKIFGYKRPMLKDSYIKEIKESFSKYEKEFKEIFDKLLGKELSKKIIEFIKNDNFEEILKLEPKFTKNIKKYTFYKRPLKTIKYKIEFYCQKINRIIFNYRKYAKTFSVMAPDGTGKTTFLDNLIESLNFYYVNNPKDNRFHVYHFRPGLLPNLGELGEKAGIMEQDKDFENPHRSKPANPISSFLRCSYYVLDYIVGWQKCVRNDVHYDRFSIFDRYCYDIIVDPLRTKLNLPKFIRKFLTFFIPKPKIVFYLEASPDVILSRKKELTREEIVSQTAEYKNIVKTNKKRFKTISAEKTVDEMVDEALKIILNEYTERI